MQNNTGSSTVTISQYSNNETAAITQNGPGERNQATVTQGGNHASSNLNNASITQNGADSSVTVSQDDTNSTATVTQNFAWNNQASVTQGASSPGHANAATITQASNYNQAAITQNGQDNIASISQDNFNFAGNMSFNTATIDQGNLAYSYNNTASIEQHGSGSGNNGYIEQNGSGNTATIYQNGAANTADIVQASHGNTANLTQNGSNNTFTINQ